MDSLCAKYTYKGPLFPMSYRITLFLMWRHIKGNTPYFIGQFICVEKLPEWYILHTVGM